MIRFLFLKDYQASGEEAWRKEEEALALVHMGDVGSLEMEREIDISKSCLVGKIHRTS